MARSDGTITHMVHADLVITGARVRVARDTWAEAVAVQAGRVQALGDARDVLDLVGPSTRVVDAPAGLVLPGFVDAHNHAPQAGLNQLRVWLNDASGPAEYLRIVADYAAAHPGDGWILGGGWSMEHFPGGNPRREDLDAVVGDRPVFLFNRDVHGAWVNTAALRAAGITRDTPDPADGRIERDPVTGEPTGSLHEGAAYSFEEHVVPAAGPGDVAAGILHAQQHLHRLGVTSWQDAWVTPQTQQAYVSLVAEGLLRSRVVGALWWDRHRGLEQIDELVERRAAAMSLTGAAGAGDGHEIPGFHASTVKIMTDGVLENGTGALLEPYCLRHAHGESADLDVGLTYVDADLLAVAVTRLDQLGFSVHMHTIGDRAVRNALDAVAAAHSANGPSVARRRHHLAHIQIVQPQDVRRFAELGVVANCQTFWAKHEPQMDDLTVPFIGAERAQLQYPFESLRRAGATLAMGSDWPVTTADPLQQIEVAVTRRPHDARAVEPLLPAERLLLDDAVDAFTAGSAFVNHDPAGGVLRIGGRADLVVVDTDLLAGEVAPADARIVLSVVSGAVVHDLTG